MSDNEIALMDWQVAKQTVFNTAVAPTARLLGIKDGTLTPEVESSAVEEARGTLIPAYNATLDKISGSAKVSGDASAEQLGYFLDSALGEATPSGTTNKIRDYAGPIATKPVSRMLSLVRGSAEGAYGLIGGVVNELSLKCESNARLSFDASLIGHSVAPATLGVALTDPVVNYFHANQMTLFLDLWAGVAGTTAITSTAFSMELGINMNKALKMGLGSPNPKSVSQNKLAGDGNQLKLAVEFEATQSKAWFDAMIGASAPFKCQARMVWSIDANTKLQIDYAGFTPSVPEVFSDADGIAQLELTLSPLYHVTLANWLKIQLTNQVATLP